MGLNKMKLLIAALTILISVFINVSEVSASIPASEANSFINNYFSHENPDGKRKRFPALFTVYFAGLDHEAHDKGMGSYIKFFKETTDPKIKEVITTLKDQDEFDNKIFIITADHGHTAMPEFGLIQFGDRYLFPDTSCSLNVEDFDDKDIQDSEKANNNLHIWEMGEVMSKLEEKMAFGLWTKDDGLTKEYFSVLTPEEIAITFTDITAVTSDQTKSNVITALNGPMAHVYVKANSGWWTIPAYSNVKNLAEVFRLFMQVNNSEEASAMFGLTLEDYQEIRASLPRLKTSIDTILIRKDGSYKVYTVERIDTGYNVKLLDLESHFDSKYIDAINRISGMNNTDRSGDIVLIMKDEVDVPNTDIANYRFTTGVSCKSWHGSLNKSDSYVPFIFAYPGGNKTEIENILQKNTVCNTDYGKCKGNWTLTNIIKEIISEQYE